MTAPTHRLGGGVNPMKRCDMLLVCCMIFLLQIQLSIDTAKPIPSISVHAARAQKVGGKGREEMAHRAVLSPRRQDASTTSSYRLGVSDTDPLFTDSPESSGTVHVSECSVCRVSV